MSCTGYNQPPQSRLRATNLSPGWDLFAVAGVSKDRESLRRFAASLPGIHEDFSVSPGSMAGLEISYPPHARWTPIPEWYCVIIPA